jgi:hypothetical protein
MGNLGGAFIVHQNFAKKVYYFVAGLRRRDPTMNVGCKLATGFFNPRRG